MLTGEQQMWGFPRGRALTHLFKHLATAGGIIHTWGSNLQRQLGASSPNLLHAQHPLTVALPATTARGVTCGDYHTVATMGECELRRAADTYEPSSHSLTSMLRHSCTVDGSVYGWGRNAHNQLGTPRELGQRLPRHSSVDSNASSSSAGSVSGGSTSGSASSSSSSRPPLTVAVPWSVRPFGPLAKAAMHVYAWGDNTLVQTRKGELVVLGQHIPSSRGSHWGRGASLAAHAMAGSGAVKHRAVAAAAAATGHQRSNSAVATTAGRAAAAAAVADAGTGRHHSVAGIPQHSDASGDELRGLSHFGGTLTLQFPPGASPPTWMRGGGWTVLATVNVPSKHPPAKDATGRAGAAVAPPTQLLIAWYLAESFKVRVDRVWLW